MKNVFIIGFVLMIAAQWYAPLSMIFNSQKTILEGREYKFKTQPVDPSDPFRGKYITLSYEAERYVPKDTAEIHLSNRDVYATIETDSAGFARITKLTETAPASGDYIKVWFDYQYDYAAFINFPFKTFYLEESKASEAEQLYWRTRTDSTVVCYAKVKVLHGDAKLTDVIINDSSIADVVKRINEGKEKED